MPYSKEAKYDHNRQLPPENFDQDSFKTVPLSHTDYKGDKFNVKGAKAVVGKLKESGKWDIQSILVPKGEMAHGGEIHGGDYQLTKSATGKWQVKDWDGVVVKTLNNKADAIDWIEENKYKDGGEIPDLTKPQKGHWLYNSLDWLMNMTKF
jgi:hypothetical protein